MLSRASGTVVLLPAAGREAPRRRLIVAAAA
jgi:hypothetical protein